MPDAADPARVAALADEIHRLRPAWTTAALTAALTDPAVAGRPWSLTVVAINALARDPATIAPGRLRADGPWWPPGVDTASALTITEPCGSCGPNRQIEINDEQGHRIIRCPTCHPLAQRPEDGAA